MRVLPALLALVAVALAGCGGGDGDGEGAERPPATALEIRYDDGRGKRATASLRCGDEPAAEGWLAGRDAAGLCDAVGAERELLTEPPDPRQACILLYGGPQTAHITGTLDGEEVDRRFSRTNGCRIDEWDRLAKAGLLPEA